MGPAEAQPDWLLGVARGLGGLVGDYPAAALQPRLPQRGLRLLLGAIALALSVVYLVTYARA